MLILAKEQLVPAVVARLRSVHSVLEIGPGIKPQRLVPALVHICVEPYRPYAEVLLREHPDYVVMNCSWDDALGLLPAGSVDSVVLTDVIEHLEKSEGRRLLDKTVTLARSQLVVQTPLGFLPQGENEIKDAWGMDGVDWQMHRSGWLPEDFPDWEILECEQFHFEDAYGRPLAHPHGAFFAILDKGPVDGPETQSQLVAALKAENLRIRLEYEQSTSWRLTRPLRAMGRLVSRG